MTIVKNIDTIFKDVKCFQIRSFNDERGSFREVYNKEILDIIGSTVNFIQDNESHSEDQVTTESEDANKAHANTDNVKSFSDDDLPF